MDNLPYQNYCFVSKRLFLNKEMVKIVSEVEATVGQTRWMGLCNGRQSHTWMAAAEAGQI